MIDKSFQTIPQDPLESRSEKLVFPKQAAGFLEIVIVRTVFPKSTDNHLENRHDPGSYTNRGALLAGKKDRRDEEGSVNA